ncbi:DUF4112 domain-containing protein [Argonema antarcticum]|uniref:DUF4112 domain-containing protein n=1 Tax=Argonema antarcticum TaxID=2942763 RepID=UPI0020122A21|nr:DUF4112 domain-containing protein [Argonema antarcticum]MCL1469704.1 DUF4112 domain-containing protein [Argonema antarcticum A004/B2]
MSNSHDSKAITLKRLRSISYLLDNAIPIPGTNYRVGIDPILGLIPGGGDTISAFLSAYIVLESAQLGVPREALLRMVYNILLDTMLGSVPVLGDLFDASWKANVKNISLLESHLASPIPSKKVDRVFIILLLVGLILFVMAITFLSVLVFRFLLSLFTGN